ncbi:MAG TPA: BPSL0067 family protein [Steroidobacteraceae bacterium]|jgi:hypothetical protein
MASILTSRCRRTRSRVVADNVPFVAVRPERYIGQVVGSGQCVAYVRETTGLPPADVWRRGDPVSTTDCARHTAVATFDANGRYGNHSDGRSHAAIFQQQISTGIRVLDQWVGHPVTHRVIRWKEGVGKAADDASRYYIIEIEAEPRREA